MRKGIFSKLAVQNIRNNKSTYIPYMITCIFCIAMIYMMEFLRDCPTLDQAVRHAAEVRMILSTGEVVVVIFCVIFLIYSNSFLMKRRQKEIGLYNILGLERNHIGIVLLLETIFTTILSLTGGIAIGILASKLSLLLLLRLLHIPAVLGFYISTKGIITCLLMFGAIFLLILLLNLRRIHLSRPVELLRGNNTGEREPKAKWLMALLGFICLGIGYYLAITTESPIKAITIFLLAVILVMAGTYLLFTAGSIVILKFLRRRKSFYYKTGNFISISGMLYRMKQNAVGLANICILSTMVLVTVSTTVSLYAGLEGALERMYPYDVDVVQSLDEVPPEQETTLNEDTLERVQAAAADAGRKVELLQWSTPGDTVGYYTGNTFTLVAQEGVSTEIRLLTADDYGRLTGHTVDLEPEEVLVQAENLDLPDTFYIEDLPFHIAGTIMDFPRYNSSILISGQTAQLFLVVADETVVSAISDRDASRVHREFRVQVDLDGTEEEKLAFVDPLLAADANDVYSVISHQDNAVDLYTMYGGFLFLGVFLGLLFLLSTVLIIYYKQISEGYEDQRRYQIMQQVGMSPREVRSSIRSQVLLVFFLPLVTAGIHVAAAFPMLCKLLELFNLFDVRLFALCAAGTLLVFCAIYALVYGLTTRTYSRIVGGQ